MMSENEEKNVRVYIEKIENGKKIVEAIRKNNVSSNGFDSAKELKKLKKEENIESWFTNYLPLDRTSPTSKSITEEEQDVEREGWLFASDDNDLIGDDEEFDAPKDAENDYDLDEDYENNCPAQDDSEEVSLWRY